jgi:hypothetical protein
VVYRLLASLFVFKAHELDPDNHLSKIIKVRAALVNGQMSAACISISFTNVRATLNYLCKIMHAQVEAPKCSSKGRSLPLPVLWRYRRQSRIKQKRPRQARV